eukprot:TRINITY_DN8348_c0_g1_i1.p1 TRINITY_DN8348_c0_g1~~TRINITY_DN8348_c0_g1_i1.p1  ORF type:complete len:152 (+),score=14.81 TRINITY_DN8348_c0_g1_i1:63-458(+)
MDEQTTAVTKREREVQIESSPAKRTAAQAAKLQLPDPFESTTKTARGKMDLPEPFESTTKTARGKMDLPEPFESLSSSGVLRCLPTASSVAKTVPVTSGSALLPPQLRRPNVNTEDAALWNSGKKAKGAKK